MTIMTPHPRRAAGAAPGLAALPSEAPPGSLEGNPAPPQLHASMRGGAGPQLSPGMAWPQPPAPEDIYISVTLDIEPVTKSRARISPAEYTQIGAHRVQTKKARGFSTQAVRDFQEQVGWLLRQAKVQRNEADDLGVHTAIHVRGKQRRDIDNMVKSLLDGCNGVAWRDDQQVIRLTADLIRDSDHPRIDLIVYVIGKRSRDCPRCGKALTLRQVGLDQVFCSKECYDTDQRKGTYRACVVCGTAVYRTVGKALAAQTFCSPACRTAGRGKCRQCGGPNDKPWSGRRFCSTECSVAWHQTRALAASSTPAGVCSDCGGATYSVGSKRCRACHIKNVAAAGRSPVRRSAYDTCPDCGSEKRVTAIRCVRCFRAAISQKRAGRWKVTA